MPRTAAKIAKESNRTKPLRRTSSKQPSRPAVSPEPQEFPVSHSVLRSMYDAMVESRLWTQSRGLVPVISEATAVATAAVLHRTDTLAAPADGRTLYPVVNRETKIIPLDLAAVRSACAEARRRRRGSVIAICPEDVFFAADFRELLRRAQEHLWPLICIALTDGFFNPAASVPEIDVDGHDAVAMYRVVSECVRRARNQRGPAIIHAHDATDTKTPDPLGDPLARFGRYLEAKGLTTLKLHVVHAEDQ